MMLLADIEAKRFQQLGSDGGLQPTMAAGSLAWQGLTLIQKIVNQTGPRMI